jgi:hypothetical protein
MIDLGLRPRGRAVAIRDRDYREEHSFSADRVSERTMCREGGRFHYWNSGDWRTVNVPRGIVVSATALSSFAGAIYTTEV